MTNPLIADLQMALDPPRLFRRATGLTPDDWQARLLRSTAPRVLLASSQNWEWRTDYSDSFR